MSSFYFLIDDVSIKCIGCKESFTANKDGNITIQYTINVATFSFFNIKYNNTRLLNAIERRGEIVPYTKDSRWVIPTVLTRITNVSTFDITLRNVSIDDDGKQLSYEYIDDYGRITIINPTQLIVKGK